MDIHPQSFLTTAGEAYIADQRSKGKLSPAGARNYGITYRQLHERHKLRIGEYTTDHVITFLIENVASGAWKPQTQVNKRSALNSLFKWCIRRNLVDPRRINPEEILEEISPKVRTHRRNIWLDTDEIRMLLSAVRSQAPTVEVGARDAFCCEFILNTGLRAAEAGLARWSHFRSGELWVPKGKGDKERTVHLTNQGIEILKAWRAKAAEGLGAIPSSQPIIPPLKTTWIEPGSGHQERVDEILWGGTVSKAMIRSRGLAYAEANTVGLHGATIHKIVSRAGETAGIAGLAPHDLRRTYAGQLEAAGVPIQEISHMLGHESLDTTVRYLEDNPAKHRRAMANVELY